MAKQAVKHQTKPSRSSARHTATPADTNGQCIDDTNSESLEEIARDNDEWDALVANTPPEKLALLSRMFDEQIKRGGLTPLDFNKK